MTRKAFLAWVERYLHALRCRQCGGSLKWLHEGRTDIHDYFHMQCQQCGQIIKIHQDKLDDERNEEEL